MRILRRKFVYSLSVVLVLALASPVFAAPGTPRIINLQGRLMNSSGTLLGGSGTEYCFQFSFYDVVTSGAGTKVWPSGTPSIMTVMVRNGSYNAGVGDTAIGGDTLDFNFQDTDTIYLNVEVASKVGGACGGGDETFETLSPRQRILAAGYAINASMLGGYTASQDATNNQIPVLSMGRLILGGANAAINATSTNALTFQDGQTGDIRFFSAANAITAAGNATFAGRVSATGVSTTNATATNLNVTGAFTFGSASGVLKAVAGVISAALLDLANDVTGILAIINGGTGTSTAPVYGQLLVGNAIGGYDLIATSSLGIIANGSLFDYLFPGSATSTLLNFTGGIISSASSTIGNGTQSGGLTISGNATTTGTLAVQGTGTSTFAGGIDIAAGCFSVGGECIEIPGGGGGSGVLVDIQSFSANGTYIPSAGATIAYVIVTGAGGGGGGADSPAADTANEVVGGGGGAGGTSLAVVDVAATTSVKVFVGTAGTGGANTGGTGGTGGQSRFSTFATGSGGVGGGGSAVNAACAAGSWGTAGTGGSAGAGDVNVPGGDGHIGDCLAEVVFGGLGGGSYWGGGGRGGQDAANVCTAGATAGAYGAGGGGATCEDIDTGALGGAGASGVIVVYEYGPFTGELGVDDGGTGTTTAPTYGQMLVGDGVGGYNLVATSSLGINGVFSTTSADHYAHSSTTIAKTYAANIFGGLQTFGNASTTNISSVYASSTSGFFGALSLGSLNGVLKATAGTVSASLLNLATETTGVLAVANGGTGWGSLAAGTLLTGNGAGAVATTTVASSLQLSGGQLSVNTGNANLWSALQSFTNASSSIFSATRAYFGGTATTTIDAGGNVSVGGLLNVAGSALFSSATTTTLLVTSSSTLQDFTSRNATSSLLHVAGSFSGAGLSTCSGSSDKLLWNSASMQFTCGADAGGAGSGISSLGAAGQLQSGATQTFATTTDTNIRIGITSAGDTHTFTPTWQGTLATTRGGTGWGEIAAGTLLTGNGSGAVATTSIGGSLQIAVNTLALNLANANIWTGLQQFSSATSSVFESVTQLARTIQSTSTNALVLRTSLAATAGLTIGSTSTPQMLSADTANNRIVVGNGGSSPILFVLDTKNTGGDPTGLDGAEYYNSNTGDFRCYSGIAWRTCGGIAASSTGDVQFRNTDGSFTATTNFNWSLASNALTIQGNTGQTSDLFTVASSTGTALFGVSSAGVLELATTSDPTAPSVGLNIYAKEIAGRSMPKWIGPSGVDTSFQANFGFNRITIAGPGGGTTNTTVTTIINGGYSSPTGGSLVYTQPTPATTNLLTSVRRSTHGTGATAGTVAYHRQNTLMVTRGNSSTIGGFFFTMRFGTSVLAAGSRVFAGVSGSIANPTNVDPLTSAVIARIGMAINANTGNWNFVHNVAGTAPTVNALGASFPVDTTSLYELILFAKPNDTVIRWRVTNLSTGAQISSTTATTNIPTNTTYVAPQFWATNNATAGATTFDFAGWYLESDN